LTTRETRNFLLCTVIFALAALLPLVSSGYWLTIGVSLAMYTVLATAWTMFSGPTNYISLAPAAFFGLGMYIVAGGLELMPYPVLVLISAIAGALLSFVVGLATCASPASTSSSSRWAWRN
jgi:branched-chain amino acid transport system permease protein